MAQVRYASLKQKQFQLNHDASIENTVSETTNNTSIELPQEIKELITGSDYWIEAKTNRYKMLIRQGYGQLLMRLACEARAKHHPANWFATVCSKANWQQTLDYAKKLADVAKQATYTAQKLGTDVTKFIYKQVWKGVNTIRLACLVAEMPHDKPGQNRLKHFAWLCKHGEELYATSRT